MSMFLTEAINKTQHEVETEHAQYKEYIKV